MLGHMHGHVSHAHRTCKSTAGVHELDHAQALPLAEKVSQNCTNALLLQRYAPKP